MKRLVKAILFVLDRDGGIVIIDYATSLFVYLNTILKSSQPPRCITSSLYNPEFV